MVSVKVKRDYSLSQRGKCGKMWIPEKKRRGESLHATPREPAQPDPAVNPSPRHTPHCQFVYGPNQWADKHRSTASTLRKKERYLLIVQLHRSVATVGSPVEEVDHLLEGEWFHLWLLQSVCQRLLGQSVFGLRIFEHFLISRWYLWVIRIVGRDDIDKTSLSSHSWVTNDTLFVVMGNVRRPIQVVVDVGQYQQNIWETEEKVCSTF